MAKTQEELKELKEEYEALNAKLKELSEEEIKLVTGGANVRNDDGTITLLKGQCYYDSYSPFYNTYKVLNDYINVSDNTSISCLLQWKTTGNQYKYENATKNAVDFTLGTFCFIGVDKF